MNKDLQLALNLVQQSQHLSDEEKEAITKSLKGADKEFEIVNFKLDRTEKVKKTTAILLEETIAELEHKRKAVEEQNRELEIEAALERVRSKAMAMRGSSDILGTTTTAFEELQKLGIHSIRCGIGLLLKNSMEARVFASTTDTSGVFQTLVGIRDMNDHPSLVRQYQAWLKQENIAEVLDGEELKSYYNKLFFQSSETTAIPKQFDKKQYGYYFSFADGLFYSWSDQPYSENEINILIRFNAIVALTFRRFLDLQKAEAQAREAQIEAALERVRSRTMAMYHSNEIADIVGKIFGELRLLDLVLNRVLIWVFNDQERYITWWSANPEAESNAESYRVDYSDQPVFLSYLQAWQNRTPFYLYTLSGDTKRKWEDHLFTNTELSKLPIAVIEGMRQEGTIFTTSTVSDYGLMMVGSFEPLSNENGDIIQRFGRVFQQSYTRYLDVQKAEDQAREARIEAALEKVRSRSMGMQKSEELREVIRVVYEQFVHLNTLVEHAGFIMDYKERDDMNIWLADQHEVPFQVTIPYFDCAHWNSFLEAKEKGKNFFANRLSFEEKNEFYQDLFELVPAPDEAKQYYLNCPGLAISTVLLDNVGLYIENFSGIPYTDEENNTLMRFGKVFQQTYTRFLDLQKAEAQALEAIKRASVDRVRAEIASMRTTKDLERITPLVWNELTTLGVPFIRCGVFIMDEEKQQIETHLSTPGGEAIATFNLPYSAPGETAQILAHWHEKKLYKQHWDEKQFVEFTQNLVQQGAITSGEKYLTENRPTDLYLHFLPFLQGMLYTGNTSPLSNDELQLMQNLADAFSTAYARYQDFNRLEVAKKQVDSALTELQAAQKQLIQSEKMASLGELTAGIAHEIQNPLNFVNNFSDVNKELIEELKSQKSKLKSEEVDELLDDIAANEEKINHHGKRADAIVKGMLQHSRSTSTITEPTDINVLADEYLRLAYHGLRAKEKSFNAKLETDFDSSLGKINVVPQDIGRVLLNLINNAFYAVNEKQKHAAVSSVLNGFEPTVSISTTKQNGNVEIRVKDNGNGIPKKIVDKIFQPFFTTKPTGQGTGLGLSLAYDIVKAHGGEIEVETKEGEGTTFIIQLRNYSS